MPPPGWYPDPRDHAAQRYWDGRQWTGLSGRGNAPLRYLGTAPWSPVPPTVPSSGISQRAKIALAIGGAVAGVLLILVNVTDYQKSRDCEAAADHEGYRGAEKDQAVKFCEDYSGPARVSPRETVLVPVPAPRHREPYDLPGVQVCDPVRRWDVDCNNGG